MTKFITFLLLVFTSFYSFSQDKIVEIEIKNKRSLTALKESKNGYHYIKTAKHVIMAKYKDGRLLSYDNDLNRVYDIDINENDYIGNPFYDNNTTISNYANYFNNVNQLINKKGEIKPFNTTVKSDKGVIKQSNLKPKFSFFNDYGFTVIGPKIGRKNYKKEYEKGDIKIWTLKHEDLTPISSTLETPEFTTNQETVKWYLGDVFEGRFNLLTKDETNEEKNLDTYHIVTNKFDGKIDKYTKLKIKLENNHFLLSQNINGVESLFNSNYGGSLIYNNLYYNEDEKTFAVYGFYTNTSKKQVRVGKIAGFYVHKFNNDGELIWKENFPFDKLENEYVLHRGISYEEINSVGYIYFSIKKDKSNMYMVNSFDGNLLKKEHEFLNKFKKTQGNYQKKEINNLNAIFSDKTLKNKFFSSEVIQSFYVNPKIKAYISKQKNKNNLYYDAQISTNGNVILKEFNKKERVLKFLKFII